MHSLLASLVLAALFKDSSADATNVFDDVNFLVGSNTSITMYHKDGTFDILMTTNDTVWSFDYDFTKNLVIAHIGTSIVKTVLFPQPSTAETPEVVKELCGPSAVTVEWDSYRVYYWSDCDAEETSIMSCFMNGEEEETVFVTKELKGKSISRMVIDPYMEILFWTADGVLQSVETSGRNYKPNMTDRNVTLEMIGLNVEERLLYYVGRVNQTYSLHSIDYNNEDEEREHPCNSSLPWGSVSALGVIREQVYWLNKANETLPIYDDAYSNCTKVEQLDNVFSMRRPKKGPCLDKRCDHLCVELSGAEYLYTKAACQCFPGWTLDENGISCVVLVEDVDFLVGSDDGVIMYHKNETYNYDTPVIKENFFYSLDYHFTKNLVFAAPMNGIVKISPMYPELSTSATPSNGTVIKRASWCSHAFAVDWVHDRIYYADNDCSGERVAIMSCGLDGEDEKTVVQGRGYVKDMAIDPYEGILFWLVTNTKVATEMIQSSDISGENSILDITRDKLITSFALDVQSRRVYYVARRALREGCSLYSIDYTGSREVELVSVPRIIPLLQYVHGLSVVEGKVFWVQNGRWEKEMRYETYVAYIDNNKEDRLEMLRSDDKGGHMRVVHPSQQTRRKRDPCLNKGCEHTCVIRPRRWPTDRSAVCQCPPGQTLNNDGVSCQVVSGSWPPIPQGKKRFYVEDSIKTDWFGAFMGCLRNKSRLVSIECMEEMEEVKRLIKLTGRHRGSFWTSGTDYGREGNFVWATSGKELSPTSDLWLSDEPNNWKNNEHCVDVWERSIGSGYGLNDKSCQQNESSYICEYYSYS